MLVEFVLEDDVWVIYLFCVLMFDDCVVVIFGDCWYYFE